MAKCRNWDQNDLVDILLCCFTFTVVFFFFTSLPDPLNIKIRTYGSEKRFAKRSLEIVAISFPKWCFFCFTCSVVFISVLLVLLQVCCLWKRDFSSLSNFCCKVFRGMPIIATKSIMLIILIIMIILIVKSTLVMLKESLCAVGKKLKPKWICP